MKTVAAAMTGLFITAPSIRANEVRNANVFQDLGFIKATCIYNSFGAVDSETAKQLLNIIYDEHNKINKEIAKEIFKQSLDAYPKCISLFPKAVVIRLETTPEQKGD